ncbi:ABC transporter permease [Pseudactinotalea sp. HY158]|uniref:ABC transporter permease n=1 Tax=Pseudactinotalea sp. HY158 TaxID=2654547 RepID=UPI00129C41B0|nr:ABC transporter permease [Pseudactinotalea sp. HY158]QGH70381.1 ABC transporter permease [Pseudactinotalea sp. HY158]
MGRVIRDLWGTRGILWVLIRRDLKVRYAESMLGYVWSVLEPLMMGVIYWFVFEKIMGRNVGGDPYIIFLMAALLPWMWFTSGLTEGAKALRSQRRLVASTALPRQIWVLRSVGGKGIEFLFSIPVFVIFLIFYPPQFNAHVPFVLLGLLIQLVLLLGLGFLLSPIMMLFRDLEPLIRIATRALFYASPIIYSINDVLGTGMPEFLKVIYKLNPVTGIMEAYRAGFFPEQTHLDVIAIAGAISVLTLVVGWITFGRMERAVLKEI